MAATATLLKASCSFFVHRDSTRPPVTLLPLKWRNPTTQNPLLLPSIKKTTTTTGFIKCSRGSNFSLQCVMNSSKNCFMEDDDDDDDDDEEERKRNQNQNQNPFERFTEVMLKSLQKPVVAAIMLGVLLFACDPNAAAIAASGGRMGGRAFSSSSSSSRSSSSSSSSPSRSSSSSSPSRSSYSSSSSSGSNPSFSFYSSSSSSPPLTHHSSSVPGPSFSSVLLFVTCFSVFVSVAAFLSDSRPEGSVLSDANKTTVLKLQVGLLGMARSFQRDLNRIAETADTSTSKGLSYILQETILALLRHPDSCISGYSFVDVKRSIEDGEKLFDKLSIEERGKFDEETLVNVNNIKKKSTTSKSPNGFSNEYIVITILVAAEGAYKLPAINSSADLKEALQTLGSISSRKTMAVEILWTPQKENDTLTERELREDYPLLRPL